MSAFTNYLETEIVEYFLRNQPSPQAATVYLALFTADPGETGSLVNEIAYDGYARQPASWTTLDTGTGQTKNATVITFPANGNVSLSVTATHAAIIDQSALGNGTVLIKGALAASKTLAPGDVLSFAQNALTITID